MKNGESIKSKHVFSMIWKREQGGWKVLHSHESWMEYQRMKSKQRFSGPLICQNRGKMGARGSGLQNCKKMVTLLKAESRPEYRYSVREIISAVCEVYGVGVERIRLGGRLSAEIRGVAGLLSLELPGCGLVSLAPEVARDATSLSYAARRVAERAKEEDALQH